MIHVTNENLVAVWIIKKGLRKMHTDELVLCWAYDSCKSVAYARPRLTILSTFAKSKSAAPISSSKSVRRCTQNDVIAIRVNIEGINSQPNTKV